MSKTRFSWQQQGKDRPVVAGVIHDLPNDDGETTVELDDEDGTVVWASTRHRAQVRPGIEVDAVVVKDSDGAPRVKQITFMAAKGEEISPADLRIGAFDELRSHAMVFSAVLVGMKPPAFTTEGREAPWDYPTTNLGWNQAYFEFQKKRRDGVFMAPLQRSRKRTRVDDARLKRVAAAFEAGGVQGVRDTEHVSARQAYRLVEQARQKGFLPAKEEE